MSWQQVASAAIDLVLCDLQMPVMAGVELLRELRAGGSRVPLLFMSAGTNPRAEAMAHGADGYLAKPLGPRALSQLLGSLTLRR